jgi:hypothetical protein
MIHSNAPLARAFALALALPAGVLASSSLIACGSSAEPTRASPPPLASVTAATPPTPPRALRDAPLTATSPDSVLVDPGFAQSFGGSPTWGHWLAIEGSGSLGTFTTSTLSTNPLGIASPVAAIPATPAAPPGGKAIDFLAPFPGGTGAATASLWVSRNDPAGQPIAFDAAGSPLTISVLGFASLESGKGIDLTRDESATTVIAGRTWYRYRADIAGGLELSGFFEISVLRTPGNFLFTGPELLPKDLATLPQPMARAFAATPRALRANELAAMASYRRLAAPLHLSAQGLRKRMPRAE